MIAVAACSPSVTSLMCDTGSGAGGVRRYLRSAVAVVTSLTYGGLLLSCGRSLDPVGDSCTGWPEITATSITPPVGTQVHKGEPLEVVATFAYTTCREGRILAMFQDQTEAGDPVPMVSGGARSQCATADR
jgi:hypothetical protein